jgi:Sec-independent protein translocase protein TatA
MYNLLNKLVKSKDLNEYLENMIDLFFKLNAYIFIIFIILLIIFIIFNHKKIFNLSYKLIEGKANIKRHKKIGNESQKEIDRNNDVAEERSKQNQEEVKKLE